MHGDCLLDFSVRCEPRVVFSWWLLILLALSSCRTPPSAGRVRHRTAAATTRLQFQDITAQAGVKFRIEHDKSPLNILETLGHGGALLDYDNDGRLDLLLIAPDRLALFHNEGDGRFREATQRISFNRQSSIVNRKSLWMGCAVGDYNNDGWADLFVTGYRCFALFRNERGRLTEVSNELPMPADRWTTSAAFFDSNRDGHLDLYVGCYLEFGARDLQLCEYSGVRAACHPTHYEPQHGLLFRNLGGARGFVEATREAGLGNGHGKTLGVAVADYDGDGLSDLYLANDAVPSDLFRNLGGRFVNVGLESGTSLGSQGREQGAMGVDWGDYDNDGRLDLIVTTFQYEPRSLYRNLGRGRFLEWAGPTGIAEATIHTLGFGVKFFDADNDGDLDLLMANGHIQDNVSKILPSVTYAQPSQLFENRNRRFTEIGAAVAGFAKPLVGRSVAIGDLDNDGRLDALVTNLEGAPRLLRNATKERGNYLQVRLVGNTAGRRRSPRDGAGAVVIVRTAATTQLRVAGTSGSYLCAGDARVHFGLDAATVVDELTVRWPSGVAQRWQRLRANQVVTLTERAK